jgi:hypothetical protein
MGLVGREVLWLGALGVGLEEPDHGGETRGGLGERGGDGSWYGSESEGGGPECCYVEYIYRRGGAQRSVRNMQNFAHVLEMWRGKSSWPRHKVE